MDNEKDTVRLRAACDRCHSQKLKCPRTAGIQKCNRCNKARTSCVFSPFRQKKEACSQNEAGRASINAQLTVLEERIISVKQNNLNAIAGAGTKRKRTLSQPRETNC